MITSPGPRTVVEPPLVLAVLFGCLTLLCTWCTVLLVFMVINIGSYEIDGEPATRAEFLRVMGIPTLVFGGLSGVAAWALRRERTWAREAILVFWGTATVVVVLLLATQGRLRALGWLPAILAGALGAFGWYLYFKGSVRTYYNALARGSEPTIATPVHGGSDHPTADAN